MPETHDLDVHLATCADCAGELARYSGLFAAMGSLRHHFEELPAGFTAAVMARIGEAQLGWSDRVVRVAQDHRLQVGAAAVVGAAAIGLLWWRAARRGVARAA